MAETETLTLEQRRRFLDAAERPLRVRRNILLLAAHATGHKKHPHGDWCETCEATEKWPCPVVQRAAGPSLNAFTECDPVSRDDHTALLVALAAAEGDRDLFRAERDVLADNVREARAALAAEAPDRPALDAARAEGAS